jgi:hypothetical protein
LDVIFEQHGNTVWKERHDLPPRDDLILRDPVLHQAQLDKNFPIGACPPEHQESILSIIKEFWDVFDEAGLRNSIRGYQFNIDTGNVKPICCKTPSYGPYEKVIIQKMVTSLDQNGLTEPDDGPWGSLVVLAAKPNDTLIPWDEYQWRLCVSYRRVNQVTRPFTFPIRRCDEAVDDIGPCKYYIMMDLDSGYWQVMLASLARDKTAFFSAFGKHHWTVMPMGLTNAMAFFVCMLQDFQQRWDKEAASQGLQGCLSQVIVDDILLASQTADELLAYFGLS